MSLARALIKRQLIEEIMDCGSNEDDDLKRKAPEDKRKFSCYQRHEIDEMVEEIKEETGIEDEIAILEAIRDCCCEDYSPASRVRSTFKDCVKKKLKNQGLL
jgi:hypothetical protein